MKSIRVVPLAVVAVVALLEAGQSPVRASIDRAPPGQVESPDDSAGPAERLGRRLDAYGAELGQALRARAEEWGAWGERNGRRAIGALGTAEVGLLGDDRAQRSFVVAEACISTCSPVGEARATWQPVCGTGIPAGVKPLPASSERSHAVVLIHGLDEPDGLWLDLAPALLAHGHRVLKFEYPNDQSPADSAEMLAVALTLIARPPVGGGLGICSVDLVGHSMGGLIVRDLVTRPGWYAGISEDLAMASGLPPVRRAILLAAPNAGSRLTPLQPLSEAREQVSRAIDGRSDRAAGWLRSLADGAGEAASDLSPGSGYLNDLNARTLPSSIKITNIIATMGVNPFAGESEAASIAERVIDSVGDGLVSRSSQELAGVSDSVHVLATHRGMIQRWRMFDGPRAIVQQLTGERTAPEQPAAVPIILERLARQD